MSGVKHLDAFFSRCLVSFGKASGSGSGASEARVRFSPVSVQDVDVSMDIKSKAILEPERMLKEGIQGGRFPRLILLVGGITSVEMKGDGRMSGADVCSSHLKVSYELQGLW